MEDNGTGVSLSDLQVAVMQVLWNHPGSTTAEVAEALRESRGLAYTTVATLLTRLEKRGVVESSRDGRQLQYAAKLSEAQVKRSMVSGLLSNLFKGSATALLSHLLREDEIGPSDIERMRAILERNGGDDV